jgi:muramoyltetrapeptide carboxypeptidase
MPSSALKPKALKPGDTVMMVSPASPIAEDRLTAITELLEADGYRVEVAPHALECHEYLAGTDADRASDLLAAFEDSSVQAVLCTRGGYGCARLLPMLDFDRLAAQGKMFLGFSDITTLHVALNRRGLVTYHAPMALTLSYEREPWVYESFRRCLRGDDPLSVPAPRAQTITPGKARGRTIGGCLCLLADTIGTVEPLETAGKILLIEDVDESPHRLDAMLTHLRNVGLLQRAAGIVFGEMTRSEQRVEQSIGGRPWRDIVIDRVGDLGIPSVLDFPFGHMKTMLTVPLGLEAELDADAGMLRLLETPCA